MRIALLIYFLLASSFVSAEETGGKVILNPVQLPDEEVMPNYGQIAQDYVEDIKYYHKKYPGTQIEEDFVDDIREKHPDYSMETAGTNEKFIRVGIRGMRLYNKIKNSIKEFLLENDLPISVDDSQIEYGDAVPYQDNGDEVLVINDFKKIISYSDNERDRLAVDNKVSEKLTGKSLFQRKSEFKKALMEGDWKKIFTYGLFDGKIVDDKRGIGEWGNSELVNMRFLTVKTAVDENGKLTGALQMFPLKKGFLLSEDFKQYSGLELSFANSENLDAIEVRWPIPYRLFLDESTMVGYWGNIIVPFSATAKDAKQPLLLKAELKGTVCGETRCQPTDSKAEIMLEAGTSVDSEAASFLRIADIYSAKAHHKDITVKQVLIEHNAVADVHPIVRIEVEAGESITDFDIFIKDKTGIKFDRPLVRIDGKKVVARFKAMEAGADLSDHLVEVSIRLNQKKSIRQEIKAEEVSLLDSEGDSLSLSLVAMALFGGFLLNLMPCVFPVLSLKLLSFGNFGAKNQKNIRESFVLNVLGIWCSFAFLIAGLCGLKWLGRSIGWGMQFQNVYFLSSMIFVVAGFLSYVWGCLKLPFSGILNKVIGLNVSSGKLLHFFNGFFVVLLSTPCTAPYLGTAVGFALSGDYTDIIVILSAVALGLSLPYLLFALFPDLIYLMPNPGKWMSKVSRIMGWMLFLTLVWLLNILYAQTSGALLIQFIAFICVFWIILWFHKTLMDIIDQQPDTVEVLQRTRNFFHIISFLLIGAILVWSFNLAKNSYDIRRQEISATSYDNFDVYEQVQQLLNDGRTVFVRIGADWCLTCKLNDVTVFDGEQMSEFLEEHNVSVIDVDWTNYNEDILNFMKKFGRQGLPFYILFSRRIPDGVVLPEIVNDMDFRKFIENLNY